MHDVMKENLKISQNSTHDPKNGIFNIQNEKFHFVVSELV